MSISSAQALVRAFHRKFDLPAADEPQDASYVNWDRHNIRLGWIEDEIEEGDRATDECDVAELADAYLDIVYFALGGLVELGIDGGDLFDAIHQANMSKIKLPGVAKIAKGPDWKHPDIAALIETQRKAR